MRKAIAIKLKGLILMLCKIIEKLGKYYIAGATIT